MQEYLINIHQIVEAKSEFYNLNLQVWHCR